MNRIRRIFNRNLLWVWLVLCPASLWAAPVPAGAQAIQVALFAPYSVERAIIKTGDASLRIKGHGTTVVKAGGAFQVTARKGRVGLSGLRGHDEELTVEEIQVQLAQPESDSIEITTPATPPQKLKGRVRIKAGRGRLVLIEEAKLEDYLAGVVWAEAAEGRHPEALQAQAIVSRTFAVKNLKRHAQEGYDLCSSTHCQVYRGYGDSGSPTVVAAAVTATAGMILQQRGRLADAYYSSNCGGQTATAAEIWPGEAKGHASSVRDNYCHGGPHSAWRFRTDKPALWQALKSDPRTDPGRFLRQVRILSHGTSGRAVRVAIAGEQPKVVSGWIFRQVLARVFGWASIKSTLFNVTVAGNDVIFEGRGLGHGVGLCQTGAAAMAEQGQEAPAILWHYYPGARIALLKQGTGGAARARAASQNDSTGDLTPVALRKSDWRVRSSEHFLVKFTAGAEASEMDSLLAWLESIRAGYIQRTGRAPDRPVEVIVHPTTAAFTQATGRPWWVAAVAAVTGDAIEMQPVRTLRSRGVLASTLRHEYAHIIIQSAGQKTVPLWLVEGFAIHLAGEGERRRPPAAQVPAPISEPRLEALLKHPASREQMQIAYYLAYQKVKRLIAREGEDGVWRRLKDGPKVGRAI